MRLENIIAIPHPYGNRIDLKWENPQPDQYPGVKVVRREGTFPTTPDDGYSVVERNAFLFATDLSIISDLDSRVIPSTLYQQFLNKQIILSNNATVSIEIQGSKWLISDREQDFVLRKINSMINAYRKGIDTIVDQNLKSETVYYYTFFPFKGNPHEYIFGRYNRVAAMATGQYDMAGQMYNLLPGIYHRYDTVLSDQVLDEDREKGELRRFLDIPGSLLDQFQSFAKAILNSYNLDKVDGRLLPLLAQWIGWKTDFSLEIESQRNEIRNAPSIYRTIGLIPTVEATVKRVSGWESRTKEFVHNVFLSNRPERLNIWVRQRSTTGEWSESTEPLSLDFAYEGRPTAVRDEEGVLWLFYHTYKKRQWNIWYKTFREDREWSPSQPFTNRKCIDKYPTAALQGETLWVFWSAYDETDQLWRINYRTRTDGDWSTVETFADPETERNKPWAVVDDIGGLWLFWLERVGAKWQLKYNRHDGTVWELDPAASFPLDGAEDPRVEGDVFVFFHPTDPNQRIWVFWARQEPTGSPDQTRWTVVYRVKQDIDPSVSDWSVIRTLPKATPNDYHDREPAAIVNVDGNIELFWSSNRNGSWSIWRNILTIATHNWGTEEQVTNNPYSQRDPLPLSIDEGTLLIYRSNESLSYTSEVYGATETVDFRYAGCTTVDTQNAAKIALRGKFEDFQTYTYDAGKNGERTNTDWYARDTIGLYLNPDTMDPEKTQSGVSRIHGVLSEFMPTTDRAVFVTQSDLHTDCVYTYDAPGTEDPRFIDESYEDTLTSPA